MQMLAWKTRIFTIFFTWNIASESFTEMLWIHSSLYGFTQFNMEIYRYLGRNEDTSSYWVNLISFSSRTFIIPTHVGFITFYYNYRTSLALMKRWDVKKTRIHMPLKREMSRRAKLVSALLFPFSSKRWPDGSRHFTISAVSYRYFHHWIYLKLKIQANKTFLEL